MAVARGLGRWPCVFVTMVFLPQRRFTMIYRRLCHPENYKEKAENGRQNPSVRLRPTHQLIPLARCNSRT
jgi:hypothetical protein